MHRRHNIQHLHDETLTLPIFYQRPLHNKHSHRPPYCHYNRHKNKHAPYIYIDCLWTSSHKRKSQNCAHFLHTLSALKRSFPASLVSPLPNSEQINHPSSNHTYTKSTTNYINHNYVPSMTHIHTTHIIFSPASTYAPCCHPWICGQTSPD